MWASPTTGLTLKSLVTPPPVRSDGRSHYGLNRFNPSLRAWLAPILSPDRKLLQQSDDDDNDDDNGTPLHDDDDDDYDDSYEASSSRQDSQNAPPLLNRYNLNHDVERLLLTLNPPEFSVSPYQREASDLLHDSVHVAHLVADLLSDHEAELARSKFPGL